MFDTPDLDIFFFFFFFQAEDGIRDLTVTGVQTCALPILIPFISWGMRLLEPVAMQRSLPDLMNGITAAAPIAEAPTRPDSRSVIIGPVPRYGTCSMENPEVSFRYSNAR